MMAQQKGSRLPMYQMTLPPVAVITVLISYLLLNVGLAFLSGYSPLLGVISALVINLVIFLLLQPRLALPLYILLALPTIVFASGSTGIISRLYPGNVLLALVILIGLARTLQQQRKSGQQLLPANLMFSLIALVF